MHCIPIVHGDLNCVRQSRHHLVSSLLTRRQNNVLLDADHTARLGDFGYASLVGNIPEVLTYLQRSTARPGALRWIAPEQVDEETFNRTTKSDIYSFGCVALQESPLDSNSRPTILITLQVLSGKEPWSEVRQDSASCCAWQRDTSQADQCLER